MLVVDIIRYFKVSHLALQFPTQSWSIETSNSHQAVLNRPAVPAHHHLMDMVGDSILRQLRFCIHLFLLYATIQIPLRNVPQNDGVAIEPYKGLPVGMCIDWVQSSARKVMNAGDASLTFLSLNVPFPR